MSHKFVTVRSRQQAVAVRISMLYGLDDRNAQRGLDQYPYVISMYPCRGGCWGFAIKPIEDVPGLRLECVVDGGAVASPPVDDDS